jgi:hypothetical protein
MDWTVPDGVGCSVKASIIEEKGERVMKMLLLALLVLIAVPVSAATLGVGDDESVAGNQPDTNFGGQTYRGGLWTGQDSGLDGPARFYLMFDLPDYQPGLAVGSATLYGYYNDDWSTDDNGLHDIYLGASDAWSQATITWNNQPGTLGSPIATWDAATATLGTWQSWDITSAMNGEYMGDGVLTLVFRAQDESPSRNNWEYFAEKDYSTALGFYIDYTIVPEPGLVSLFGLLLGGAALALRRRA